MLNAILLGAAPQSSLIPCVFQCDGRQAGGVWTVVAFAAAMASA
jgi:hypothetical protein